MAPSGWGESAPSKDKRGDRPLPETAGAFFYFGFVWPGIDPLSIGPGGDRRTPRCLGSTGSKDGIKEGGEGEVEAEEVTAGLYPISLEVAERQRLW